MVAMSTTTTTHLNFRGTAREALTHYATIFGGQPAITTYGDVGMPAGLPDTDKVLFGLLASPDGFRVMAYDVPGETVAPEAGATRRQDGMTITDRPFFLAASGETLEEVTGHWEGLVEGGTVIEPLAASAWSAGFGMLTDRFGVTWVLDVQAPAGS
jgi:PhnB protein